MSVSTVIGLIGLGADIYQSYQSEKDAEDYYDSQARLTQAQAEQNATNIRNAAISNAELSIYDRGVAVKEANEAFKAGELEARNQLYTTGKILAAQKANYGKSGVALGMGTPLEVVSRTASEIVRDALLIKYNGKTASNRSKELANRYKKVAETDLENAFAHAALVEEAGIYDASYYSQRADASGSAALYSTTATAFQGTYDLGYREGWWD